MCSSHEGSKWKRGQIIHMNAEVPRIQSLFNIAHWLSFTSEDTWEFGSTRLLLLPLPLLGKKVPNLHLVGVLSQRPWVSQSLAHLPLF